MSLKIKATLAQIIARLPEKIDTVYIAFSGGLDSSVLLDQLATDPPLNTTLCVLHINHQLSEHATAWEAHCEAQAKKYHLDYQVETVSVENEGKGLEAAARQARYAVFAKYAKSNCAIVTAHHADDQVETVLQRILRGTGIAGLTGIPMQRKLAQGYLLRPLLETTRVQLIQYATDNKLDFITDESNFDCAHTRNLLRHKILPELQEHFSGVAEQLLSLQANAADAEQLLVEYAAVLFAKCKLSDKQQINCAELKKLSEQQQRLVIRYWLIQHNQLMAPSREQLRQLLQAVLPAAEDKQPSIKFGELLCQRYQQQLYLTPLQLPDVAGEHFQWDLKTPLQTPVGKLDHHKVRQHVNLPDEVLLDVQFRKGGENFHPAGRQGTHPLKKCLQEWQIPPWQRNSIPLLYYNKQLIYVYGYAVSEGWDNKAGH